MPTNTVMKLAWRISSRISGCLAMLSVASQANWIVAQPAHPAVVYFVDDNFIGNRKATRDMLPHLVDVDALERVRLRRLDADEHGHEVGLAHQLEDLGLLGSR
jgi:hypothetical protein